MTNTTELQILSRILRKLLKLDPDFYGKKVLDIDFKKGNICQVCEVNGIKSIDLNRLKQ